MSTFSLALVNEGCGEFSNCRYRSSYPARSAVMSDADRYAFSTLVL
jgi:hypothetical protein